MAHTEQRTLGAAGKLTRSRLRDWYARDLESKVARAVAEGHVPASKAADLHRLVGELFDDADGRVSR